MRFEVAGRELPLTRTSWKTSPLTADFDASARSAHKVDLNARNACSKAQNADTCRFDWATPKRLALPSLEFSPTPQRGERVALRSPGGLNRADSADRTAWSDRRVSSRTA